MPFATSGIKLLFLVFILKELPKTDASEECPEVKDEEIFMLKIDSMCYHYVETPDNQVTFSSAKLDCASRGGHLATIKNNNTQSELVRVLQTVSSSHTVLIGLQRHKSVWTWVTGDKLGYSNWESTTTCQDCDCAKIKLRREGLWEKFNCQASDWYTAYVCEYAPASSGSGHNQDHPLMTLFLSAFVAVAMALLCH